MVGGCPSSGIGSLPLSHTIIAEPLLGYVVVSRPQPGVDLAAATVGGDRPMDGDADRAGGHHRGELGDLPVTERDVEQHRLGLRVLVGVRGEVLHVAAALATVPQHLQQIEDQHAVEVVRVGRA